MFTSKSFANFKNFSSRFALLNKVDRKQIFVDWERLGRISDLTISNPSECVKECVTVCVCVCLCKINSVSGTVCVCVWKLACVTENSSEKKVWKKCVFVWNKSDIEGVCVRERERERVCVWVWVCVCEWEKERESLCECMSVFVWNRREI